MPSLGRDLTCFVCDMPHGGQDWGEMIRVRNDPPWAVSRCQGFSAAH